MQGGQSSLHKMFKILQANLNRGARAAHDLIIAEAMKRGVDVLAISEPNRNRTSNTDWEADKRKDAAFYFCRRGIEVNAIHKKEGYIHLHLKDIDLFSCYCSPNAPVADLEKLLEEMEADIRNAKEEALVMEDLNAKAAEWGSPITDARGKILGDWMATLNLVALNNGKTPTFRRNNSESFIDVTLATPGAARRVHKWEVLEAETLSDHKYIYLELKTKGDSNRGKAAERQKENIDIIAFKRALRNDIEEIRKVEASPENCTMAIKNALRGTTRRGRSRKRVPYWWNEDIESCREECVATRRRLNHARRRGNTEDDQQLTEMKKLYKGKKREIKRLINSSKREHWKELCEKLEKDIWGDGYRITVRHLKGKENVFKIPSERKKEIATHLFPTRNDSWEETQTEENVSLFTHTELVAAIGKLRNGRAPGPDDINAELIKAVGELMPDFLLETMNRLLKTLDFPDVWKRAKLVLIPKPGKDLENPGAYRPICLLDTLGKLYEVLLRERQTTELDEKEVISPHQYGFRRGKSKIQAGKSKGENPGRGKGG